MTQPSRIDTAQKVVEHASLARRADEPTASQIQIKALQERKEMLEAVKAGSAMVSFEEPALGEARLRSLEKQAQTTIQVEDLGEMESVCDTLSDLRSRGQLGPGENLSLEQQLAAAAQRASEQEAKLAALEKMRDEELLEEEDDKELLESFMVLEQEAEGIKAAEIAQSGSVPTGPVSGPGQDAVQEGDMLALEQHVAGLEAKVRVRGGQVAPTPCADNLQLLSSLGVATRRLKANVQETLVAPTAWGPGASPSVGEQAFGGIKPADVLPTLHQLQDDVAGLEKELGVFQPETTARVEAVERSIVAAELTGVLVMDAAEELESIRSAFTGDPRLDSRLYSSVQDLKSMGQGGYALNPESTHKLEDNLAAIQEMAAIVEAQKTAETARFEFDFVAQVALEDVFKAKGGDLRTYVGADPRSFGIGRDRAMPEPCWIPEESLSSSLGYLSRRQATISQGMLVDGDGKKTSTNGTFLRRRTTRAMCVKCRLAMATMVPLCGHKSECQTCFQDHKEEFLCPKCSKPIRPHMVQHEQDKQTQQTMIHAQNLAAAGQQEQGQIAAHLASAGFFKITQPEPLTDGALIAWMAAYPKLLVCRVKRTQDAGDAPPAAVAAVDAQAQEDSQAQESVMI